MGDHPVERFVRAVGMRDLHDFDLVELVQAVQSPHVLAVGAGLAPEAGGIGGHLDRKVRLAENHVAVNVRHGNFGRRDQVEIVRCHVVHLAFLVGELAGSEARGFVDHQRGHDFGISRRRVAVEKERDQRALQGRSLSLVHGEARSGQLHAQLEIDDVVFAGQLPVRERVGGQLGRRSSRPHDDVVGGGQAVRHVLVRKVGQLDDFGV